jgi:hypothetical protein
MDDSFTGKVEFARWIPIREKVKSGLVYRVREYGRLTHIWKSWRMEFLLSTQVSSPDPFASLDHGEVKEVDQAHWDVKRKGHCCPWVVGKVCSWVAKRTVWLMVRQVSLLWLGMSC